MPEAGNPDDHWLVQPATIRILWVGFAVALALTVLADFFIDHQAPFGIAGTIGFNAWFGFLSCVVLIAVARGLGFFLKRKADYYDR